MPTGSRPAPPAGTARVAIRGTILGHEWVNVFYLELTHTDPVTVDDLSALADAIDTEIAAHYPNAATTGMVISEIKLVFIPTAGSELAFTKAVSHVGSGNAAINDAAACVVVNWVISDYYRGGHPRTYFAGADGTHVTNGSDLDSASRSGLAASANDFRNGLNAITTDNITAVQMGTVRFQSGGEWLSPPVFRPYTSVSVRTKLGSQRRRILS